jgi:NAD(P)-dependent dehydrogenase (short-subunit alcohol dehydrogenase family)/acyl dehydratase
MKSEFPEAALFTPEQLYVGLSAEFEREITDADIYAFAHASGDANPLHVDADYARSTTLANRIVHGAFQVGLASALIGMHLPGREVLLGSITARFSAPLYYPTRVRVAGQIMSWNLSGLTGLLKVTVREIDSQIHTAEIFVGFTFHGRRRQEASVCAPPFRPAEDTAKREIVLVTGASGGIGTSLVASLCSHYYVLAQVRKGTLDEALRSNPNVREIEADLRSSGWERGLETILEGRRLYGIVHAAWPAAPHGSLLESADEVIEEQLTFGASRTIGLARFLALHADAKGGRLIVLGSIYGTHKPLITLASYSLGKATLEHTVRLLAPELARKKITVNVVSPSFIATGMNKEAGDKQRKREVAMIPMGRLCLEEDVNGVVRHLLSAEFSFVSGQVIGLTGAQL